MLCQPESIVIYLSDCRVEGVDCTLKQLNPAPLVQFDSLHHEKKKHVS